MAKRPAYCATVDCALILPPSRLVGIGPGGSCQYLSECESTVDCAWAIDLRDCCGCPAYHPRRLVERDDCLQDPADSAPKSCAASICSGVRCAPPVCPALAAGCGPTDVSKGLRVCKTGS